VFHLLLAQCLVVEDLLLIGEVEVDSLGHFRLVAFVRVDTFLGVGEELLASLNVSLEATGIGFVEVVQLLVEGFHVGL
jgi:hypothetical protein